MFPRSTSGEFQMTRCPLRKSLKLCLRFPSQVGSELQKCREVVRTSMRFRLRFSAQSFKCEGTYMDCFTFLGWQVSRRSETDQRHSPTADRGKSKWNTSLSVVVQQCYIVSIIIVLLLLLLLLLLLVLLLLLLYIHIYIYIYIYIYNYLLHIYIYI